MKRDSLLQRLLNMPTVGYWSAIGGVEVKEIKEEGVNTYVYCVSNAWSGTKQAHRLKVVYTANGGSVRVRGYTLQMSDCLRV